jgi:hypothetical protein
VDLYIHSPTPFMALCLVNHRDNFTILLPCSHACVQFYYFVGRISLLFRSVAVLDMFVCCIGCTLLGGPHCRTGGTVVTDDFCKAISSQSMQGLNAIGGALTNVSTGTNLKPYFIYNPGQRGCEFSLIFMRGWILSSRGC